MRAQNPEVAPQQPQPPGLRQQPGLFHTYRRATKFILLFGAACTTFLFVEAVVVCLSEYNKHNRITNNCLVVYADRALTAIAIVIPAVACFALLSRIFVQFRMLELLLQPQPQLPPEPLSPRSRGMRLASAA